MFFSSIWEPMVSKTCSSEETIILLIQIFPASCCAPKMGIVSKSCALRMLTCQLTTFGPAMILELHLIRLGFGSLGFSNLC
jgi:hypothetical protein